MTWHAPRTSAAPWDEPPGTVKTLTCAHCKPIPAAATPQGRSVVVLCNLKARNMRGVKSFGMLMAASDKAHENVELVR